jgi:hypothetical protein
VVLASQNAIEKLAVQSSLPHVVLQGSVGARKNGQGSYKASNAERRKSTQALAN